MASTLTSRGQYTSRSRRLRGNAAAVLCIALSSTALAHDSGATVDAQARTFLESLSTAARDRTRFDFDDTERFRFRWTPGAREGIRLGELDGDQRRALGDLFRTMLSEAGIRKVDAILATEAALGVIESAPDYRDPQKYWTAMFGDPGAAAWGLRFEGHHLSLNFTFRGADIVSATPLFLGANPERIPSGPDEGLRALAQEVDLGWALYRLLGADQRDRARGSDEWFGGFLTSAGDRRADLGKPAGIPATELDAAQQQALRRLIRAYVETVAPRHAAPYLQHAFDAEWASLRFYWKSADAPGDSYYYRIAGERLLIEHDNRSGGTHVHAVWRDSVHDFGGQ